MDNSTIAGGQLHFSRCNQSDTTTLSCSEEVDPLVSQWQWVGQDVADTNPCPHQNPKPKQGCSLKCVHYFSWWHGLCSFNCSLANLLD